MKTSFDYDEFFSMLEGSFTNSCVYVEDPF